MLSTARGRRASRKKRAQQKLKEKRLEERKTQQKAFGEHDGEVRSAERRLGEGENVPGSELNLRVARSIYRKFFPLYSTAKGRAVYRDRLDAAAQKGFAEKHRAIAEKALKDANASDNERARIERRVRELLYDYFDQFGMSSQVGAESEPLREVKPWMEQLISDIESNELRQYERQAREAAEKASTLLRGEFINALTARIGKMERELQSLNRSLYAHPFHNERYSFHRTQMVEFQPILKIIEIAKTSPEALDMLFRATCPMTSRTRIRSSHSRRCSRTRQGFRPVRGLPQLLHLRDPHGGCCHRPLDPLGAAARHRVWR
ncbi:hypothetical protein ACQ5SK_28970 [Bradyrhizobium japonicum]